MATPRKKTAASKATRAKPEKASATKGKRPTAKKKDEGAGAKVVLLSGGNPQIGKADGNEVVQKYIEAMPEWKREVGRRVDAIIEKAVPKVKKAVRWNSPLYGVEGWGWFLSYHCFAKYVKLTFFKGTSLVPMPPGESKTKETRYLDIRENDKIDEKHLLSWIKQAAAIPGWDGGSPKNGGVPL
jgi:hypothetical protein